MWTAWYWATVRVEYTCQPFISGVGGPHRTCTNGERTDNIRCLSKFMFSVIRRHAVICFYRVSTWKRLIETYQILLICGNIKNSARPVVEPCTSALAWWGNIASLSNSVFPLKTLSQLPGKRADDMHQYCKDGVIVPPCCHSKIHAVMHFQEFECVWVWILPVRHSW